MAATTYLAARQHALCAAAGAPAREQPRACLHEFEAIGKQALTVVDDHPHPPARPFLIRGCDFRHRASVRQFCHQLGSKIGLRFRTHSTMLARLKRIEELCLHRHMGGITSPLTLISSHPEVCGSEIVFGPFTGAPVDRTAKRDRSSFLDLDDQLRVRVLGLIQFARGGKQTSTLFPQALRCRQCCPM